MHGDAHALATSLAPLLREHCGGRLGPIEWFQCAWQTSGAATGFSTWTFEDGRRVGTLVKIPVGPVEHRWTAGMGLVEPERWDEPQNLAKSTPRVLAGGLELGGYDLAWLVTERLAAQPLSQLLDGQAVHDLIEAAADFQAESVRWRPEVEAAERHNWPSAIERSRVAIKASGIADAHRWNEALKKVHRALPSLLAKWNSRDTGHWCHGDLHPGNALRRVAAAGEERPARGCVLIDLALVHAGHWVEDAVYLERQFWGHAEKLHGVKPVTALAAARRARGLRADDDYSGIATVRRVLMASVVPLFLDREHNLKYTHASLEVLEKFIPQVH